MYQVMIVDDEEPVLDSFAYILNNNTTDFELCAKARSGTEAVRLIYEHSPDLVFMDIQMPGINGIDVIKQVRNNFPKTVFILATAYERFDIAQKAIPLGVFSYIVKPVSRKTLLYELQRVKIHLDSLKEKDLRRLEDTQLLKKTKTEETKRFLCSLIWRNQDENSWKKFLNLFSIDSERGVIYLLEAAGDIAEDIKKSNYETIKEKIQFKFFCLSTVVAGRMLIFFPEESSLNKLDSYLDNIIKGLSPYTFIQGKGGVYPLVSLHSSFLEAFQPFAIASEKEDSYSSRWERMKLVRDSILDTKNLKAEDIFEDYWMEVFNKSSFSAALGKMVALFTLVINKIDRQVLISSNFYIDPAEEIMALNTIEEWQRWAKQVFNNLRTHIQLGKNQSYPRPLTAAIVYIRENYQKPIQLSMVAEACNVTSSYLSRLFSEYLGTNFSDYINQFRVNKAIILLEEKKHSIKEVAYLVGYQDPNYFSRIFRRHMGISPSDLEKEG